MAMVLLLILTLPEFVVAVGVCCFCCFVFFVLFCFVLFCFVCLFFGGAGCLLVCFVLFCASCGSVADTYR